MNSGFMIGDYVVMAIYFLVVVALGVLFAIKEDNTTDYLLGGRKIPWWAIAISMVVTLFSAISFVSIPGEAYKHGLGMWISGLLGVLVIPLGFVMFLGFYYRLGSFTPYEYLEKRFTPQVRLGASVLFLATRGLYLAIVLYSSAKAFEAAMGWPVWVTILITGVLGALYTTLGGMKAVVWTDVLQFFVLAGGIVFAVVILVNKVEGGFAGVISYAFENGRGFNLNKDFISLDPHKRITLWLLILAALGTTLSNFASDQLTVQRLLSTKNFGEAKRATFTNMLIVLPLVSVFWFIGIGLFAYYHQAGAETAKSMGLTGDQAFSYFITTMLPTPIPGLLMAGLLAAVMSTLDSGINSLSAIVLKDIYKRFMAPNVSELKQLRIAKKLTLLWAVFMISAALGIDMVSDEATTTIMELAGIWGGMAGILLGVFILGVTTTRVSGKQIIILAGISLILLFFASWKFYYNAEPEKRISFILIGNSGLIFTVLAGYFLCLFTKRLPEDKVRDLTLLTLQHDKKEVELNVNNVE